MLTKCKKSVIIILDTNPKEIKKMKVEELNKIFEIENIIDKTILSNSDELMLNENEKNSFYKMKCFLDELE